MLWLNTESTEKPSKVTIGQALDGVRHVRLADNIREETRTETREDGQEETQVIYVYDEVEFDLGPERTDTEKEIKRDFPQWWEFASQKEEPAPTVDERLTAVEDYLMELAMGL